MYSNILRVFPFYYYLVIIIIFLGGCDIFHSDPTRNPDYKTPVIYSTDLFHPHGDMDDQVDLATLFALENVDIRAVILDNTAAQIKRPGSIPLSQISSLTKKEVPYATGLSKRLSSLDDTGEREDAESQQAVSLILSVLRKSKRKVSIVTVGSLRDIAAAYNRDSDLFHEKIGKIFVFAGEASKSGFVETNVRLDRNAFVQIMNSGLPIAWVPCFDGGLWTNGGRASFWRTSYKKLLSQSSNQLRQYFIYSYKKLDVDPIEYLSKPINTVYERKLLKKARNLWCCAIFPAIENKQIILTDASYKLVSTKKKLKKEEKPLFSFSPVKVRFNREGEAIYGEHPEAREVMQFRINDQKIYNSVMTSVAADLLSKIK